MALTRISEHQLNTALQNATATAADADLSAIASLGDSATGYLKKSGPSMWVLDANIGVTSTGVTSVVGTGSVSGLTLTGNIITAGNLTLGGNLTLTNAQVVSGLGFTPYNNTNPNSYITSAGAPVQLVAGRNGSVTLAQADISGLTTSSSPTFASVTAMTFTGNVSGSAATVTAAAQPAITSVGTLTSLTMGGNINMPKTSGSAMTIDGMYGWRDLIGDITPRAAGGTAPTLKNFIGTIKDFTYSANNAGDTRFHIPHDYAPGTDMFLHVHWSHNGTNISGTLVVDYTITYAKGHQQAAFSTPKTLTMTSPSLNITNTPQYMHRVDEIQMSTNGGSASLLDSSLIEVDGLVLLTFVTSTIPSITGSAVSNTPYLFTIDIHYQSTGINTKNKSPNFYS